MASPTRKRATCDDLLKLPEDQVCEILSPFLRLWGEERTPLGG